MQRLYFSHSYDLEDLRYNESLWKLLMDKGFHAWIDSGRDVSSAGLGARRPMDIGFNEWMMSQCDGFVAIAPSTKRDSVYQWLEYRTAVRMGLPRLVVEPEGGYFNASELERISFPTKWNEFWSDDTQSRLKARIEDFATLVKGHRSAGQVLETIGRWRPRQNVLRQTVALLPPRTGDPEWLELQDLLQENRKVDWIMLQPSNFGNERALLGQKFDLLVVDVGSRGTPLEALGYIHATGVPLIRLCRVQNESEIHEVSEFIVPSRGRKARFIYQQQPQHNPASMSISRFLDGIKLDAKMQPVVFWTTPTEAARQINDTTGRILSFLDGLTQTGSKETETLGTGQSAKNYFEQHWKRAERGTIFISFAGSGGAANLAAQLARIFRFLDFRCFHYREQDSASDGRLESGEDILGGLTKRINEADIVIYLIEEKFIASEFCRKELAEGRELREQGLIELRAYSLVASKTVPPGLEDISVCNFELPQWSLPKIEAEIVRDVEKSAGLIGWALHEDQRNDLKVWLKQDQHDSVEEIASILRRAEIADDEIKSIMEGGSGGAGLDSVLRLPEEPEKQRRARQIVALLLLAVAGDKKERRKRVEQWLSERRLLQRPPLVTVANEDYRQIEGLVIEADQEPTIDGINRKGQLIGQLLHDTLVSPRPLCVTSATKFLMVPVEWACETEKDEPLAVRRPVRWRLPDVDTRPCIFDSVASNSTPPPTLVLALRGPDINHTGQMRRLKEALRSYYDRLGWPPEFVLTCECDSVEQVISRLRGCQEQVVHIAGHMGDAGLQVSDKLLPANELARAVRKSDVRLMVLNGCEGGRPSSPLASAYLTLADRLVRDAGVPEVVAHRFKVSESDAQSFGEAFYAAFFNDHDGFEPASAAVSGRKSGSWLLRYSPVVISQRELTGWHPSQSVPSP